MMMNNVILKKIFRRQFQCEHSSHDHTRMETYIRERAGYKLSIGDHVMSKDRI